MEMRIIPDEIFNIVEQSFPGIFDFLNSSRINWGFELLTVNCKFLLFVQEDRSTE